jgi:ABC-type lipoprotein export system ATPase subunit
MALPGLGLEHRLHRRPQELSLGQLRRVALARALLLNLSAIPADKPPNNLEQVLAAGVADSRLLEAGKQGSVVIVTSDDHLAAKTSKVLYLEKDKLTSK